MELMLISEQSAALSSFMLIHAPARRTSRRSKAGTGFSAREVAPPQSKGFAAHCDAIIGAGASRVFGLSTQGTDHQKEPVELLSLPFSILSDEKLKLADALGLPRFEADGMTLLTRITLILENGTVQKVFFPVENPADNAADVVAYLSK